MYFTNVMKPGKKVFLRVEASSASHFRVCVRYSVSYGVHYSEQCSVKQSEHCKLHCRILIKVHVTGGRKGLVL